MQRFYVQFPLQSDIEISDRDICHQLTRVLRIESGVHIVLFSGDGTESEYVIGEITKKSIALHLHIKRSTQTEPTRQITLYQALPNKMEKIEYILQKGVEIGIHRFVFFRSEFSQKIILSDGKKDRFQSIAREALEQCGGLVMPQIEYLDTPLKYENNVSTRNIVLDTTGTPKRLTEMPRDQEIGLWVGPEGGWSEDERSKMRENGFIFVRF